MQTTSLSSAALTGSSSSTFMLSNGAYDASGNLLFSVKDDNIADASGTSIGTLLPYFVTGSYYPPDGFGGENSRNFQTSGEEVAIVPVPEECKKYYVIYTKGNWISPRSCVLYAVVDCSGGSPTVDYPLENNPGVSNAPINSSGAEMYFGWGLAVSKKYNGTDRYLFIGGRNGIARYTISNTGIASGTIISDITDEPALFTTGAGYYSNQELELSPDQQYLAWGNTDTEKLNILKLDASYTKVPSAAVAEPMADIRGVEFNAASTRVYVSEPTVGVQYYDFSLSTMVPLGSTAIDLDNTFLELAKNGRIYGVNSSHRLRSINEATDELNGVESSPDVNSDGAHAQGIADRHHLPDQIDGEDYENIAGDAIPTADFTINGNAVSANCSNPTELFNCSSATMTLNNLSTNAVFYRILIATQGNCAVIGDSLIHDTGFQSICPTDLKNLPGGASGTYLASNTGVFLVWFITENICGVQSYVLKYISVSNGPTGANASFNTNVITKAGQTLTVGGCTVPANTQLTYTDGSTSCGGAGGYKFAMEHSSVATPNEVGKLNTTFDLSAVSAGVGSSSYQVTVKTDQWDGSTWVSMDSDPAGETITGASSLSLIGLVSYDPLSPWYEAFFDLGLTPNGSRYKITITVSNECADYTSEQIIKLNTTVLKSASVTDENSAEILAHNFTVYPNPTNGVLTFDYSSESESEVSITISSIEGKIVKTALSTSAIGKNQVLMDVSEFDAGTYFYTVQLDGKSTTGTIIKQ